MGIRLTRRPQRQQLQPAPPHPGLASGETRRPEWAVPLGVRTASEWAWRLARRLVGDASAADDVVQDAIQSAVERPPDFTAEGNTPRG